jgi:hypothetical protein
MTLKVYFLGKYNHFQKKISDIFLSQAGGSLIGSKIYKNSILYQKVLNFSKKCLKVLKPNKESKNNFNLPQKGDGFGVFNFVTKPQ